jgi:exopolysaccharide biosynthesis predicted pyruvyltransferase EpsI
LATRVNPTVDEWKSIAQARLNRALAQIGDAEIVVTNRLHGMLLSRMSGKPVVYFDNTNRKLTAYMQTWMRDNDGVIQATDVNMAEFIAQDLIGKDVGGH